MSERLRANSVRTIKFVIVGLVVGYLVSYFWERHESSTIKRAITEEVKAGSREFVAIGERYYYPEFGFSVIWHKGWAIDELVTMEYCEVSQTSKEQKISLSFVVESLRLPKASLWDIARTDSASMAILLMDEGDSMSYRIEEFNAQPDVMILAAISSFTDTASARNSDVALSAFALHCDVVYCLKGVVDGELSLAAHDAWMTVLKSLNFYKCPS